MSTIIDIKDTTLLQSPYLSLNAAGSTGEDGSTKGIHLRWLLRGVLGNTHLPKGDYAQTDCNFNKPVDFVKIYRAPFFQRQQYYVDFFTPPNVVDHNNQLWIYNLNNSRLIYVRFLEYNKYVAAKSRYDALRNPSEFVSYYFTDLSGIMEIESPNHLFFSLMVVAGIPNSNSCLKTEILSVNENRISVPKFVYSRKTYSRSSGTADIQMICENGRSIRLQGDPCQIPSIHFGFYDEYIKHANNVGWEELGSYALNLDDNEVFKRLEPQQGLVHAQWPRFNDNARVNIQNYQDKWNGQPNNDEDRNIKMVVAKYIELSDDISNPKGNENVFLGSVEEDGSPMEMSLLDLINVGAMDFHVARMLGLGTLDIDKKVVSNGNLYIYAAEYYTEGELEEGEGRRNRQHLYLSLPASIYTQRLPIPINIKNIVPGIVKKDDNLNGISTITSPDGYTSDGRYRFVSILVNEEEADIPNPAFYISEMEFNRSETTFPVYGGLEHNKNGESEWEKPELSNDSSYQNEGDHSNETIPLIISKPLPGRANQRMLYIHKQQDSGKHNYAAYAINMFSRASLCEEIHSIGTDLKAILLKPPVNTNVLLIRHENPLFLTSQPEQERYNRISANADKTLIRLCFDYYTYNELSVYKIDEEYNHLDDNQVLNSNIYPNDFEIYAEEIEIFFRKTIPQNISGKVVSISDDVSNPLISIVKTDKYPLSSSGDQEYLTPAISASECSGYAGGMFIMGDQQFVIESITPNPSVSKPEIRVYKKEISTTLLSTENLNGNLENLQAPECTPDGLFMAIENMQTISNWGSYNPHSLKVKIGTPAWTVKREIFHRKDREGLDERFLEKSRGFWPQAKIEQVQEPVDQKLDENGNVIGLIYGFRGLHKITFINFQLPQHTQYNANGVSVEWHNGIVRLKRKDAYSTSGERNVFEILRTENSGANLVLYINDSLFDENNPYDAIQTGIQLINYYPGYKVYLYADTVKHLTEGDILPKQGEEVHYSIFGLRSSGSGKTSKISTPAVMFAQESGEPEVPTLPITANYATRPDFFGKASYTLTPKFTQNPNSVLFYRSNDEAFLNALYEKDTMEGIRLSLESYGGNDEEYLVNRWENFLDFTALSQTGKYKAFPPGGGYAFPMPDKKLFIGSINEFIEWNDIEFEENIPTIDKIESLNSVIIPASAKHDKLLAVDFIKQVVYNSFVPLTEMPIVFQHIKKGDYTPQPKKQNIKDRNGYILPPDDPDFDMAPMAKIAKDDSRKVIFTDFTLDGTSKNVYFYGVKSMNIEMKMSDFSSFAGPIKLVNTNPPEVPEVKKVLPVLENRSLGITPSVCFEINAYPKSQHIKKITLYRAFDMLDAQSIRSMKKVKEIDIEQSGILNDTVWIFNDDFSDLPEIPYGNPLCYRITVSRKIEYAEEETGIITEYAPSKPSKILVTIISETSNPDSPVLNYTSGLFDSNGVLHNIVLNWHKTIHNGKYHVYKMNQQGNWTKIKEIDSNNVETINLPLSNTSLGADTLQMRDENDEPLYHHFKVMTENSTGIFSLQENVLTISVAMEQPRYYNGWQHDLPEPDWNKIKMTIPTGAQLIRDVDGNYYCSGGYSSNGYFKYDFNLNLLKTISDSGRKNNRNMPHIIVDFLGTGKEVLIMPNYNETLYASIINLDDFSINSSLRNGFPAGKFVDNNGKLSAAIKGTGIASYYYGAAAFDLKGKSLWLLLNNYLTNGAANILYSGKFIQDWRVQGNNTMAYCFICAGGNYLCTIDDIKVSVFNFKLLIESNYNFAQAYLYSFNHGLAMLNTGYDSYYIYNDKLVMVTFSGSIRAFDLNNNGTQIVSLSNPGSNQAAFYWRNKVYRTGTKVVTTLPI